MKLEARIARRPSGVYQAWCPSLPGCVVLGDSREDAWSKIQHAVSGYLASLDVALPRELGRHLTLPPASQYPNAA